MNEKLLEAIPDVMVAKQLEEALQSSKAYRIQFFEQPGLNKPADRRTQIGDGK